MNVQLIANLVNFALFVFVLVKFAGPAVKKILHDRSEASIAAIRAANEAQSAAEAALSETRAKLAGVDAELAGLVEQAKSVAAKQAQAVEETAKADAERLRAQAKAEIARDRQSAVESIRRQVLAQAFERATGELASQMNADRQRQLVGAMIQKVGDGSLALK